MDVRERKLTCDVDRTTLSASRCSCEGEEDCLDDACCWSSERDERQNEDYLSSDGNRSTFIGVVRIARVDQLVVCSRGMLGLFG